MLTEEESECPCQSKCQDFLPTESGKTCVHYDSDQDTCHYQYDEEEWDVFDEY